MKSSENKLHSYKLARASGCLPAPQQSDTFLLHPCSQDKKLVKKTRDLKAAYVKGQVHLYKETNCII